ncbi:MAG TPA: hypothetical protein VH413_16550 [Verrucomicrobiae bacterium]|jgi:hypothetical protein|nr:hypothetical protein [Verrucomicrobiae bacterium]
MKKMMLVSFSAAAFLAVGVFSAFSASPDGGGANAAQANFTVDLIKTNVLEGEWSGLEVTQGQAGPATLTVKGNTLEFHGAGADDWLKGTFELHDGATPKELLGVVTDCVSADAIGKKIYAIYRIEDGAITIEGNPPGSTSFPTEFGQAGGRQFVFKHATQTNLKADVTKTNAFEGEWSGVEITQGQEGPATMSVKGNTIEFHGTDSNDWLKGTFELHDGVKPKEFLGVVTDCASADMIGKKIYAIYRIEDGSITIAGNPPGSTSYPATFGLADCREFVFKPKK